MASDNRLPILIFVALVVLVSSPVIYRTVQDRLQPKLVEARIVTATNRDPVFRAGPRHVAPGDRVEVAVALRLERIGGRSTWMAPGPELVLDDVPIDHVESGTWPVRRRDVRVFWFTVECVNVGGDLSPDNVMKRMEYRAFLAPEMGRGLRATRYPEAHNDDHLGVPHDSTPVDAGTLRLYARIEVFDPERDAKAEQVVSTASTDRLLEPDFPAVHRAATCPHGIDPVVGELFLLPGYEPVELPSDAWNDVTTSAMGLTFTELVERRLVVSSFTFAATAVTGTPVMDPDALVSLGTLTWNAGALQIRRRRLLWLDDVAPGDLLRRGSQWIVLLEDDGNGWLDAGDTVLHSWRRPAARTTLGAILEDGPAELELLRRGT
jgi:hypothetical protein